MSSSGPKMPKQKAGLKKKSKPASAADVATDEAIKLGQELSASILKELNSKQETLTRSYTKGGSLPSSFVWPVDAQPERMIPKNSGMYPPSEYKENFIPMPLMARPKPFAPADGAPMGLLAEKTTVDWKTQYDTDFIPLEEKKLAADSTEKVAGSLPLQDMGKLAPSFFAWNLVEESSVVPPPPPPSASDLQPTDCQVTEYQEQFSYVPPEPPQRVIERDRYKADLLGNDLSGCKDWKTEARDAQEATERAKESGTDFVAGNKHLVSEVHPDYFAWSRVDNAVDNVSREPRDNVIVSPEMQAEAAVKGYGMLSEYGSQFQPIEFERTIKTAKAEQRLQMGLSAEDIDASKWKSVYQECFVDISKAKASPSQPESMEALKTRRPAKKNTIKKSSESVEVEDEGFILVEKPEVSTTRSEMETRSIQHRDSARDKAKRDKNARELSNNVFPQSETTKEFSKSQFVTNYENDFSWPNVAASQSVTKMEDPSGIIPGIAVCSPPYALDTDPAIPQVASIPRTNITSTKSEPALNLFSSEPTISTTACIAPQLKAPYACGDMKFNALKDDKVGIATKPRSRSIVPGIPCSEYQEGFAWAAGASEAFKKRAVTACRKKQPSNDSNGFVIGYDLIEEKVQPAPAPKVDVAPSTTATQVDVPITAAGKTEQSRPFTVKDTSTRPSTASSAVNRLWVNGDRAPGSGYVGKAQFSNTAKQSTASRAIQKVKETASAKASVECVRPKSADVAAYKAQFSGKISAENSLPLNLTTRPETPLTSKVDSKISEASIAAKMRIAKSEAERSVPGKQGFTFGISKDGNVSSKAAIETTKYVYDNNASIASSLSQFSPTRPFPVRARTSHVFSPARVQVRIDENRKGANPILRVPRYPVLSDAQTGRWISESHRNFK